VTPVTETLPAPALRSILRGVKMTSDRFDMNSKRHDDYIAECRRIHDRLREISQRTN